MQNISQNQAKLAIAAVFLGFFALIPLAVYADAPTLSFSAVPQNITAGERATLVWYAQNAFTCTITGADVSNFPYPVSWSYDVAPLVTTTYTLVCSGSEGFVSDTKTVYVGSRAPQQQPTVYYTNPVYNPVYYNTPNYNYPNYNLTPVPTPPLPIPTYSNSFVAACAAGPSASVETNQIVSFAAAQTGGFPPFAYRWSGDITGSQEVENVAFEHAGVKTAKLTITDSRGLRAETSCAVTISAPYPPPAPTPTPASQPATAYKKPSVSVANVPAPSCKTVTLCIDNSGNVMQKDAGQPQDNEPKVETAQKTESNGKKFFLASLFGNGNGGDNGASKNFLIYLLPIAAAAGVIFIGYLIMRASKKA